MDASLLRSLLVSYYSTVQRALNNGAPKAIMRFLVRGCHESVYGYMFDRIARQPPKDAGAVMVSSGGARTIDWTSAHRASPSPSTASALTVTWIARGWG